MIAMYTSNHKPVLTITKMLPEVKLSVKRIGSVRIAVHILKPMCGNQMNTTVKTGDVNAVN